VCHSSSDVSWWFKSNVQGYPRLASSILTRYRDFVTTIDIGGKPLISDDTSLAHACIGLGECVDNVQELDHAISVAIPNYASLRRVVFAPPPSPTSSFHNPTFLRTRDVLLARASDIKELVLIPARAPWDGTTSHDVNGEVTVPWTACTKLETLSIANPSRAVLDVLPSWLRDLTSTLVEFHATVCVPAQFQVLDLISSYSVPDTGKLWIDHPRRPHGAVCTTTKHPLGHSWTLIFVDSCSYLPIFGESSSSR
jgi:hypothetical protein